MDALSRLPTALLAAIRHQVHLAGGLRSALAREAASKQLRPLFKNTTCFRQDVHQVVLPCKHAAALVPASGAG
jgi:hypothetical protein